ncbi:MAG: hydrogenase formation protein HypD, partial [Gammaproteobacteria bacterium]
MKYVAEYRDPTQVKKLAYELDKITTQPWTIMEVCGGQTHTIMKYSLHTLLPDKIRLIHGPGCPVCVTPISMIDHALHIASEPNTILCSFGDMLRVPGTHTDLLNIKARGADVRVILSPLDALKIAQENREKQVVFFAVGFETTAPPNAMTVYEAHRLGIKNFSILVSHVLVPPALRFLLQAPDNEVQGFLAAGHVCTVTGYNDYHDLANVYQVPIIVTGFEPVDILQGLYLCVQQLEIRNPAVINQYTRCVQENGNAAAQNIIERVFKVVDREWRGIGEIPASGLGLQPEYANYDAAIRFPLQISNQLEANGCISGKILLGKN